MFPDTRSRHSRIGWRGRMAWVGSLMLLDTASLYYRAFFGVPETVRAPDGTPVNAVRGLLDMIARLVRARKPTALVACMDADWRPAFRVAAVPSYKAHRLAPDGMSEETPPALAAQVPLIEELLRISGLAVAGHPGFEADDIMATISTEAAARGLEVFLCTSDKDCRQLISEKVKLMNLRKTAGVELLDAAETVDRH